MTGYVVRVEFEGYRGFLWRVSRGCYTGCPESHRTVFDTLSEAIEAHRMPKSPPADVRILAVADDGTETPLPTYEEALAEIGRLRGIIVAFTSEARLRADADGWCNIAAPLAAYEALCEEGLSRIAEQKKGRETP